MSDYSEAEQWERAKEWVRTNGLWIVAGVAIGALGLGGWRWYHERRATQAKTPPRATRSAGAFARNDRTRGMMIVDDLKRDIPGPHTPDGHAAGRALQVEANELDKAATSLRSVMDDAPDDEMRLIARIRLARVEATQGKYDEALATLKVDEPGDFDTRLADARGDVLLAKGDRVGALKEYLSARSGENKGRLDLELLDLKIRDLGGTPPVSAEES